MQKIWLVAKHYFGLEARKRSFILLLFLMPFILVFTIGMGYLFSRLDLENTRLGVVDEAGLLVDLNVEVTSEHEVSLTPYATVEEARAALEMEEIDAYYLLPADYAATRRADVVFYQSPHWSAWRHFRNVVQVNLLADQPPAVIERITEGAEFDVYSTESDRLFPTGGPSVGLFLPLIVAAMYAFLVMTAAGFMMEVIALEKENRTIEILVSSISPGQLMAGKIVGALGLSLIQLFVWAAFLVGTVWLGGPLEIAWLQEIDVDWRDLLGIAAVGATSYLFIGALMTTIGSTLVETQEAQQTGPFFFLLVFLPVYLIIPIASAESQTDPLVLGFTLFPPTSVMTIALRSMFSRVPTWQIAASAATGLVGGIGLVWLAGRAFRISLLRYGQRLRLRELFARRAAPKATAETQRRDQ